MTLKDFITKAATDHAVARNADAKLVAAEAARIAARDEDSAALAAETASTARLAAALPSGSAFPADSTTVVVLIDGRPEFLPVVDPESVTLPDLEPSPDGE